MSRGFASQADLADKVVTFEELGPGLYAYTAEGDPNSGVIVGDDSVLVVDTQATPVMAKDVIQRVRRVTHKPIKHLVLSTTTGQFAKRHGLRGRERYRQLRAFDRFLGGNGHYVIFARCGP